MERLTRQGPCLTLGSLPKATGLGIPQCIAMRNLTKTHLLLPQNLLQVFEADSLKVRVKHNDYLVEMGAMMLDLQVC